jgi:signal peptidase I
MSNITEWLANLSYVTVIIVIVVLVVLRFVLLRLGSPFAKSVAEIAESLAIAMGLVFLLIRPFFVQAFFIPSESMVPTLKISDHILVNKSVYLLRDPRHGEVVVFKAPPEALAVSSTFIAEGKQTDYIKRVIAVPGDEIYVEAGYLMVDGQRYSHRTVQSDIADKLGKQIENVYLKFTDKAVYVDGKKISHAQLAEYLDRTDSAIIEIHPGYVVRNGVKLNEPYMAEDPEVAYPIDPYYSSVAFDVQKAADAGKLKLIEKDGHLQVKLAKGYYLMMGDNRNHSSDSRVWGPLNRENVVGRAMFIFWPFGRVQWVR